MNQMNWTWKKSRRIRGLLVFMLLFLCSCSAVQNFFGASGTDVLLTDNPFGVTDLKSGTLMTLAESKSISNNQLKVKFPNGTDQQKIDLIAAKFGDELRFIDFLISGVNDKPRLGFESTARGLVFINPLFRGLPFEAKVAIFNDISQHPEFDTLKQKVASSKSLSENALIETEMKIAIDIAKKRGILIPSSVTSNKKLNASNRDSSQQSSTTEPSSKTSFEQEAFPKSVCGDPLPIDSTAYPVDMYPVFVDYSEKSLRIVTTELCQDAIRRTRQKTNKQSIQVGSFVGRARAEEFRDFLEKKLGNAEVGEPTRIESKQSRLPDYTDYTDYFANWLVPSANAQSSDQSTGNLEYKITMKLEQDGEIRGYPLPHGYELRSSSDGIKIVGGSVVAQQVVVVPKDKLKMRNITNDDYGGKKLLDQDVVAELLLQPQPLEIWDGSAITTFMGGSRTEQAIVPRDGGKWKHGEYAVLISAGPKLNRTSDKQPYGAYDINFANEVSDILNLITWELKIRDKELSVPDALGIGSNCYQAEDHTACLQKPDNLVKIFKAAGYEETDIVQRFFTLVLKREEWKKGAKFIGQGLIAPFDKSVSVFRNTTWGYVVGRETSKGIHVGEFSVIDPVVLATAPRNIELRCSREKTEILDMELQLGNIYCPGPLTVKNYSNYAVELSNRGADSFLVLPNDVENDYQSFTFQGRVYQEEVGTAEVGIGGSRTSVGTVYKFPFTVKRLDTRLPEKDITFNCDDKELPVKWGLKVTPRCTETGTYAEYQNYALYPIDVIFADNVVTLKPSKYISGFSSPRPGTLRSGSKTVTIKMRANLN